MPPRRRRRAGIVVVFFDAIILLLAVVASSSSLVFAGGGGVGVVVCAFDLATTINAATVTGAVRRRHHRVVGRRQRPSPSSATHRGARWSALFATATPPPGADEAYRRVFVTVDTAVAVSSSSPSSSSSSASFATDRTSTPDADARDGPGDDVDGAASVPVVPMDTPARRSLPSHLALRPFPGKGFGIVSLELIPAGRVVGEYSGEVMTENVKDRRYLPSMAHLRTDEDVRWAESRSDRGQTLTGCYLYGVSLPPPSTRGGSTTDARRVYVDAEDEYESLWTRFLNHASRPYDNVSPKSIHESYDGRGPRVWFVAKRDIEPGDEICFDYGDDYWLEGDDVVV
jgi:hypothetical protein